MSSRFYVTTPIYYANSKPHLGHLYCTTVADVLTRFHQQRGDETFFLTGTDEHGVNIERAAEKVGLPPQQHVDNIAAEFKKMVADFELGADRFIRTSDPAHKQGASHLFEVLKERGHIYKGAYEGWYCGNCNQFYTDTEVSALGDQRLCPTHSVPLDLVKEESWFFRLSQFQQPLLDYYEAHPDFVRPQARLNEVRAFVSGGLEDLSVSRATVKWGVPVPGDPDHTLYVWLDALSNYITALGYGNTTYDGFDTFWPVALHLVGKDILRFHTVYWPAFLMGAGVPLPRHVYAHGMWLSGGRKMSKTLGNVIDIYALKRHFPLDSVRHFMLRERSFADDGDFNYPALITRINGDLAGGLGNLSSRTLTLVKTGLGGDIPAVVGGSPLDGEVKDAAERARDLYLERFGQMEFNRALEAAWELVGATDRYIAERKPWALAKDPTQLELLSQTLATACEALRFLAVLLSPVQPHTMGQLWGQLGLSGDPSRVDPRTLVWGGAPARVAGEVFGLYPRIDREKVLAALQEEGEYQPEVAPPPRVTAPKSKVTPPPANPAGEKTVSDVTPPVAPATTEIPGYTPGEGAGAVIQYDDFLKVDLRVGLVKLAERIPKSDKLLRLEVDLGEPTPRQILAGIAESYEPATLVGQRVIIVANLAPRKMRGLTSQGMLLAASEGESGRPYVVHPDPLVPVGGRVR